MNLEKVWDANHPKSSNPPTQLYAYDALNRLAVDDGYSHCFGVPTKSLSSGASSEELSHKMR